MTTDEIAVMVQAGQADVLELWKAVYRYAAKMAARWMRATKGRGGLETNDYLQAAFPALLAALETWDAAAGAFIPWFAFYLKAAFSEAAGLRTKRDQLDPMNTACSLDAPLNESDGETLTLMDTQEDETASAAIDQIAEDDFRARRRAALKQALDRLKPEQRRAVVLVYCCGLTFEQAAEKMGIDRLAVKIAAAAGMRTLRHPSSSRALRVYY